MKRCEECVSMNVSLVVTAIDDFTNKPISGSTIRVWIDGENPSIPKQEGYYVFVGLRRKMVTVNLEGGMYYKQSITIDTEQYQDKVLKLRMIPNRSYPIPYNTTCVSGTDMPGSKLFAYQEKMPIPYKLLYNYEKADSEIAIFHPEEIDIEGKTLLIREKGKDKGELFAISELTDGEKRRYTLVNQLSKSYKKIGTTIYPLYVIDVDENGEFYLPISGMRGGKENFIFFHEGGEETEIELIAGQVNRITL